MLPSCIFLALLIAINVTANPGPTGYRILAEGIPQVDILLGLERISVGVVIEGRFILTVWSPIKDKTNIKDRPIAIAPQPFGHTLGGYKVATNLQSTTNYLYAPYKLKNLPNNGSRATNDIVVMELDSPIIGDIAKPIEIADINVMIPYGEAAAVFGVSDKGESVQAFFPILDKKTCNEIYKDRGGLLEGEFCAGGKDIYPPGASLCDGDLGTPLIDDRKVIGLASYIPDCNSRDNPPIFTAIPRLSNFIDSKIKDSIGTSEWAEIVWDEEDLSKIWTNLQYVVGSEPTCRIGSVRQKVMEGHCSMGCKDKEYNYGKCGINDECICFDDEKGQKTLWCALYTDALCNNVAL